MRTCQVCQAQLLEAMLPILLVVDHHSQGILVIIESVASDDAELVQRKTAELVQRKQDVACHLFNGLQTKTFRKTFKRLKKYDFIH